jgi:hypothetical protein
VLTDYSGNGRHGQLGSTAGADAADPTWTAQGLSFDGGDRVALPVLPAVEGWDIIINADATINAGASVQQILAFGDATDDENGLIVGNFTGGLTNEILTIAQNTTGGFATLRRRAWLHAADGIASGGWHLIQCDLRVGAPHFTIRVDGADVGNSGSSLVAFHSDNWFVGSNGNGSFGFVGDIAYLVFYANARSDALQAQNRAALAAILAGRGITLP